MGEKRGRFGQLCAERLGGRAKLEPDYGDPVFLEKLENFHRAFAQRYDGKPWVEFMDIGSYGDWGEGHTIASSFRDWPLEVVKAHMDIYSRCYRHTLILFNDDMVGLRHQGPDSRPDGSAREILAYAIEKGYAIRDDSVSVGLFTDFGASTLRNPEIFGHFWREKPVDLELEHYGKVKDMCTWFEGHPFVAAVEEAHATYAGFHGQPRRWLRENPGVALELANRLGYWYFLKSVDMSTKVCAGQEAVALFRWINRGVAPAYHRYALCLKLENQAGPDAGIYLQQAESMDNRAWMPGEVCAEEYTLRVPPDLPEGVYRVKVMMMESADRSGREIQLGMDARIRDQDGFYEVAHISLCAV